MQPSSVPQPPASQDATIFLRLPKVLQIAGMSRSSIYRLIKARQFPRPCRLTKRLVAWRKADIDAWSETRPLAGD